LGLLLSTSGSTGDRKLVRLSYTNIQANCDSIVEYLGLTKEERPITTLPMEYTYGLSVIHSHVAVGATIILTNRTLFQKEFWETVEKYDVTSMAGVPYTYEMFERLRLREMDLPHLKTLTQAGGHLHEELQRKFGDWAAETGRRLFVMYGQTEATARMSYVPPEKCVEKIGSIGIPIPGGSFAIAEDGELIYFGANVSMGYALKREDMALGDINGGCLKTGDMARMDEEGYFYITGRKKRFVKLQGKRFSLDQIQEILQEAFDCEEIICTGNDVDGIKVNTSSREVADREDEIIQLFMDKWQVRGRLITVKYLDEIPRNASGKVLYSKL
jgi:acyl-coenzyme A synthetase/AMP-(fatty) acid ligase